VHEGHQIAHRVKNAIQQSDSRIADVLVHIEPDSSMVNLESDTTAPKRQ
jgi:divalent metal cation (Fe/Co/Zn/Cd) transporter